MRRKRNKVYPTKSKHRNHLTHKTSRRYSRWNIRMISNILFRTKISPTMDNYPKV